MTRRPSTPLRGLATWYARYEAVALSVLMILIGLSIPVWADVAFRDAVARGAVVAGFGTVLAIASVLRLPRGSSSGARDS